MQVSIALLPDFWSGLLRTSEQLPNLDIPQRALRLDLLSKKRLTQLLTGQKPVVYGKAKIELLTTFGALSTPEKKVLLQAAGVHTWVKDKTVPEDADLPSDISTAGSNTESTDADEAQPPKRRSAPGQSPACQSDAEMLLEPGESAVIPVLHPECRLSRSFGQGSCIYSVDWQYQTYKPKTLRHYGTGQLLHLLFARENGVAYYSLHKLTDSSVASAMLDAAVSFQDPASRLCLLTTPSSFLAYDHHPKYEDDKMYGDTDIRVTDGQAEVGLGLAKLLCMDVQPAPGKHYNLYNAVQFRGVFKKGANCALTKGMLVINPALKDEDLLLRPSTTKKEFSSDDQHALGFDIVQTSANTFQPPVLNGQLVAMLRLRVQCCPENLRAQATHKLDMLVGTCQLRVMPDIAARAWGLHSKVKDPVPRTPQHLVRFECKSDDGGSIASPIDTWSQSVLERAPWTLQHGTRESIGRGSNRAALLLKAHRRKPYGIFQDFATIGFAVSDPYDMLLPNTCIVITRGKIFTGTCAVYRFPVNEADDIQIWAAVEPLHDMTCLPNNCIIVSRQGRGMEPLSGGDFDGDLVFLSADPLLLEFLRFTQQWVDRMASVQAAATAHVQQLVTERNCEPQHISLEAFTGSMSCYPTPPVRGICCNLYDKALTWLCESPPDQHRNRLHIVMVFALLAHKAYDCPKKHDTHTVIKAARNLFYMHGIKASGARRASYEAMEHLCVDQCYVADKRRMWNVKGLEEELHKAMTRREFCASLGQVWAPPNLALGEEAGAAIRNLWLATNADSFYTRAVLRKPILEIANLLLHRLQGIETNRPEIASKDQEQTTKKRKSPNKARSGDIVTAILNSSPEDLQKKLKASRAKKLNTLNALGNSKLL